MFQASGVTVSDACKTTYEEIKKDKKHRYVVFFIKDEKQIDVEVIGKYLIISAFKTVLNLVLRGVPILPTSHVRTCRFFAVYSLPVL